MNKAEEIKVPDIENLKGYMFKPYALTTYQKALAISEFYKLIDYIKVLEEFKLQHELQWVKKK